MQATYSKLKATGGWGARVETEDPFEELPAVGSEITITKRSGETSQRTLGRIEWQGNNEGKAVAIYHLVP